MVTGIRVTRTITPSPPHTTLQTPDPNPIILPTHSAEKGPLPCHMKSALCCVQGRRTIMPLTGYLFSRATVILMPVARFVRATASGIARLTSPATAQSAACATSAMGVAGSKPAMIWCPHTTSPCLPKAIRSGSPGSTHPTTPRKNCLKGSISYV